ALRNDVFEKRAKKWARDVFGLEEQQGVEHALRERLGGQGATEGALEHGTAGGVEGEAEGVDAERVAGALEAPGDAAAGGDLALLRPDRVFEVLESNRHHGRAVGRDGGVVKARPQPAHLAFDPRLVVQWLEHLAREGLAETGEAPVVEVG